MQSRHIASCLCFCLIDALIITSALAQEPVRFDDLAARPESGLIYRRTPSPRHSALETIIATGRLRLAEDLPRLPGKSHGAPGVALLDFDRDSDLDIYVTNGPGSANSLFSSQLRERGELRFIDVAIAAGVDATDQDSNGVCFGDLDNDGDEDLLVLGAGEPNRLFENRGDGTFADVTRRAGIGGGTRTATSCAMGDVDGDGRLDLAIANAYDWTSSLGLLVPFEHNQPNQLWLSRGDGTFADASASSGFLELGGELPAGAAGVTWAIAMVDFDLDGDVDVFALDNRGSPPVAGGPQHGLIHLHRNDGKGHFIDETARAGLAIPSAWLGVAFGDFNADRRLDFFATNAGDYPPSFHPPGVVVKVGDFSSRWFLGQPGDRFTDPGLGELRATPSGWGASSFDYDNDGDTDVVYHGGLFSGFFLDAGNPGIILRNEGASARFSWDAAALGSHSRHSRRMVEGLAVGDLDRNGFEDVVTVSSFDLPAEVPLTPNPERRGGPFDDVALMVVTHRPGTEPGVLEGERYRFAGGSLAVELSSGNDNGWLEVVPRGSAGVLPEGRANRDGIGAVVFLATPERPAAGLRPIVAGSSYASQDALVAHFGLGRESAGDVEILWPGGVRNRLRGVRRGERLSFPEIPCDFASQNQDPPAYRLCIERALDRLTDAGVLDAAGRERFFASAFDISSAGISSADISSADVSSAPHNPGAHPR